METEIETVAATEGKKKKHKKKFYRVWLLVQHDKAFAVIISLRKSDIYLSFKINK